MISSLWQQMKHDHSSHSRSINLSQCACCIYSAVQLVNKSPAVLDDCQNGSSYLSVESQVLWRDMIQISLAMPLVATQLPCYLCGYCYSSSPDNAVHTLIIDRYCLSLHK